MEKQCNECLRTLTLDKFNKNGSGRMGRMAKCKECMSRLRKEKIEQYPDPEPDFTPTSSYGYEAWGPPELTEEEVQAELARLDETYGPRDA